MTHAAQLRADVDQLFASGDQLRAGAAQLIAIGDQLQAGADQLFASGDQLQAGADQLFASRDQLRAGADQLFAGEDQLQTGADQLRLDIAQLSRQPAQLPTTPDEGNLFPQITQYRKHKTSSRNVATGQMDSYLGQTRTENDLVCHLRHMVSQDPKAHYVFVMDQLKARFCIYKNGAANSAILH